ncbi:sensor histidine kinase [Jiella mangrovi]|uniref:Blue-light-activated histidine kinase n=1 Tax=Jiella mangrovi TaxID=2821407 RepID=A0ABS4BDG7_9HYPH|nr:GAF domain-containing protein [Jiella mangrovi]MBP0614801.1 GAF domain-containing protein [Jiella mangrovi]
MLDSSPFGAAGNRSDDRIGSSDRLDLLARSDLLDTDAEEVFDRGVKLAKKLLGTHVALLSLVDVERQFFKAQQGLPSPYSETRETPLSHSFCKHVVATREILVVEDARKDPLVRDNLAIPDLGVIAYLGVPIVVDDGHVLGSFCAIDSKPRVWSSEDIETLRTIATGVESEIRLRIEAGRRLALQREAEADRARLALVFQSTADGVLSIDRSSTVVFANRRVSEILDLSESPVGASLFDVFPRGDGEAFVAMVETAQQAREAAEVVAECSQSGRWIEARAAPSGEGTTVFFRDVTARQKTHESRKLLVRELHHRVKNLFAIVRGMIAMAARDASDPVEMAKSLQGRLISLARAHDLIRPALSGDGVSNYQDIFLADLVQMLVEPHGKPELEKKLSVAGPPLRLGVNSTTHVALLLHELTTNAIKYGALSRPDGRLAVVWSLDGESLTFHWSEDGGPRLSGRPASRGFGSQLIELCITMQLEGEMEVEWLPTGMQLRARIPIVAIER